MKKILLRLFQHEQLERAEAQQALMQLTSGQCNEAEMAAFLTVFQMRSISLEELRGFRDALLESAIVPRLSSHNAIDLCGTGGDGKDSFNISTLSAIVVAAAGYPVIKHGNYGASSRCGSSNVLEALGYQFSNDSDNLQRQMDQTQLCFLHAPLFHPSLQSVAALRRQLGFRSFFNLLGPLVNPVQPAFQLLGVSDLKLLRLYQYLLQERCREQFGILHSLDGYDEWSLTATCQFIDKQGVEMLSPKQLGLNLLQESDIRGAESVEASAQLFIQILSGKGSPAQNQVVAANAALALRLFCPETSLFDCFHRALELIQNQSALRIWKKLLSLAHPNHYPVYL